MNILLQADSTLFLGRFHPLAVHLPIGFLLFAGILFVLSLFKSYGFLLRALPIVLLLGAISAVVSVILGLFLSDEGGYPESTLFWHQWIGISVAIISILSWIWIQGWFTKKVQNEDKKPISNHANIEHRIHENKKNIGWLLGLLVILISITGHLGGNLTHGEDYLFAYAPPFIQDLLIEEEAAVSQFEFPADPDSTLLFGHVIEPILNQKCASCHDENTKKGGLLLTTHEGLLLGGDNGPVLENGSPKSSELFKRVSMDPASRKFMPPRGTPMSYTEITLLNYWITAGMPMDLTVTDERIPEEIQVLLQQGYALTTKKKPFYEKAIVTPASEETLSSLRSQGYKIETLAEGNNFLQVQSKDTLTAAKMEALLAIKEQITWLDLGNSGLKDEWLSSIGKFTNLTRLNLDNNAITDAGIIHLAKFDYLESLNLHSTSVSNTGLKALASQKSLKRIYLWNTKVTRELADSLQKENPALEIDLGVTLSGK
ncbi:hypothetical protein D0X99_08255 [Algoriphagus lacus]|uniref:Uncharacterized protein n=1 Tax=Algoriphagus lacus TaxID=2056311 RepID=A0A418PTD4_9BACT|nr:c-type cytochrome domain-containing protein [Algoriphagus lacus]RIW16346.1 hypothetical protein D0X99_08255 [Algoriphagus lacus]